VACNPHATSSISFPQCCLMTQRASHMPNPHATSSISFPQCCLTIQRAIHMPRRLFLPSMLLDDAACNPHAASSISSFNAAWRHGVQPTRLVVYFFLQCCLTMWCATHMPHRLFLPLMLLDDAACATHMLCCLFLSLHLVYFFLSMLFDDAACNPHAVWSTHFYFYSYILLDFIRSVLEYNL